MTEQLLHGRLDNYRLRLITLIGLENIDQHESFTFLQRNYKVRPSQIVCLLIALLLLALILLDFYGLISSIVCFLLPVVRCYEQVKNEGKGVQKLVAAETGKELAEGEFSLVLGQSKSRLQIIQLYTLYFISYVITEILTPLFTQLLGSFIWLLIRLILTYILLPTRPTTPLRKLLRLSQPTEPTRRNAELSQRWN